MSLIFSIRFAIAFDTANVLVVENAVAQNMTLKLRDLLPHNLPNARIQCEHTAARAELTQTNKQLIVFVAHSLGIVFSFSSLLSHVSTFCIWSKTPQS
ncbi:hypothetical protein J1614_005564 [Plenodomus biglobosus]|nr:hypothetical protein J1614_005564 [Plenodomus biglobosus]